MSFFTILVILALIAFVVFILSYILGTRKMGPFTINPGDVEYRVKGECNRLLGLWIEIPKPERKKYFAWWLLFWLRFAPYIKESDLYGR